MDSLERMSIGAAVAEAVHLYESGIENALLAKHTVGEWRSIAEEGLEYFSAGMTFLTSGSTGVPKACLHSLNMLLEEVEVLAGLLDGHERIIVAVPGHHIYGFLFSVLLPQRLGILADRVIDVRAMMPSAIRAALRPRDLIIGHPAFWKTFSRVTQSIPAEVQGVTSTAPCEDVLARAAVHAGLQRFVQIYGSSESAGIRWRDSPEAPYSLFPYWTRCTGDDGALLRKTSGDGARVSIPDRLEWCGDRQFRVGSRIDGAVQVGGINVYPDKVRNTLLDHPAVADAAVRLMRPEEGGRLKAFIVPHTARPAPHELIAELSTWMASRLTVVEQPKSFTVGAALPVTASGKAADWRVERPAEEGSA